MCKCGAFKGGFFVSCQSSGMMDEGVFLIQDRGVSVAYYCSCVHFSCDLVDGGQSLWAGRGGAVWFGAVGRLSLLVFIAWFFFWYNFYVRRHEELFWLLK